MSSESFHKVMAHIDGTNRQDPNTVEVEGTPEPFEYVLDRKSVV